MQAIVGRQRGVMVPGVPCVDCGNWGRESDSLFVKQCLYYEERHGFGKNRALCLSHIQRC